MKVPWGYGDWQRVVVYGLGSSGRAAIDFLRQRGVAVVGVDDREAAEIDLAGLEEGPQLQLRLGERAQRLPPGVDGVVLSPGVPPDRPLLVAAREEGLPVVGEVELAFPFLNGPVVGITGSNGKSTTTALTAHLLATDGLAVELAGNIGRPLTSSVEGPAGRIFVVELSSFQLETVDTFHAQAAALLNLSPDHLDRYPDVAAYGAAKERIFARQGHGDVAVLGADDSYLAGVRPPTERVRWFSGTKQVADGCYLQGEEVVEASPGEEPRVLFRRDDLKLPGPHNLENAMASCLLALAVGGRAAGLAAGLRSFRGLPHRTQWVAEVGGVAYYDDSKGTNLGATERAVAGFPDGTVHLVLGGRSKGSPLDPLLPLLATKVAHVYLIGEAAEEIRGQIDGHVPWSRSETLPRAVREAAERATAGHVVLLSPACSSFDQYRNYAERGDHFQQLVRELGGGAADG